MVKFVVRTCPMVRLPKITAPHAVSHAIPDSINRRMLVCPMIVQMAKQPVQTAERQVKSKPAVAVYGAVKQLARAAIHATAQAQIAAAA